MANRRRGAVLVAGLLAVGVTMAACGGATAQVGGTLEVEFVTTSPVVQRQVSSTCGLHLPQAFSFQQSRTPKVVDYSNPGGSAGAAMRACALRQPSVSGAGFPG